MGSAVNYPLDRTPDEAELGFAVEELPTGENALVARIPNGLTVVKTAIGDRIAYEICDRLVPIYTPALSIDELRKRLSLR
mgnify:CR=1 FL=1